MKSSCANDHFGLTGHRCITRVKNTRYPFRHHGSILIGIVIVLIMVVCAYFVYNYMIQTAREAGKKDISQGGGKILKQFVDNDVEGMSQAIGEETRQKELVKAVSDNQVEDVEALLQTNLELNRRNSSGATVLHRAVADDSFDIARLLVQHKAAVNIIDNNGSTPLHIALTRRPANLDMVQLLLGEDPTTINSIDNRGMAPLHLAVLGGSADCVQFLIGSGADLTLRNKGKQTPLSLAKTANDTKIIEMLSAAGATK